MGAAKLLKNTMLVPKSSCVEAINKHCHGEASQAVMTDDTRGGPFENKGAIASEVLGKSRLNCPLENILHVRDNYIIAMVRIQANKM